MSSVYLEGTGVKLLTGPIIVRQKGGLPGPPTRSPRQESLRLAARAYTDLLLLLQDLLPLKAVRLLPGSACDLIVHYCRTYYKAVRVGGGGEVCVYYCSTYYKAVR